MTQKELKTYIEAENNQGMSKEQIKRTLLSSGWSEGDIDEAMMVIIGRTSRGAKLSRKIVIFLTMILVFIGIVGIYWYFTKRAPARFDIIPPASIENQNENSLIKTFNKEKEVRSMPAVGADSVFVAGIFSKDGTIDWKTILTISTIAKISPVLIIENGNKIDDFSAKLFIDQYSPRKIYTHNYQYNGQGAEALDSKNLNAKLYNYSNFVVIANGDDYASSLLAASFAARFNIPIFFTPLKSVENDLINKWDSKSIGIGVATNVDYSLTETEMNDLLLKGSKYLILTSSDDLEKSISPGFSLAAPILAAKRNGVVLNVKNPSRKSVKQAVLQITQNNFSPSYIVVVGNQRNFPYLEFDKIPLGTFLGQIDEHRYFVNLYYWANYNKSNEYIPDASVGVITGYSVSDASSLVARSLFYEKIAKSNKVVAWSPYSTRQGIEGRVDQVLDNSFTLRNVSNFKNFNSYADKTSVIRELNNASVFVYSGHSWKNILGNMSITEMPVFRNPTFIFAFGCSALEPWNPGTPEFKRNAPLIGYEAIKNGAVGFLGSAEVKFMSSEMYFGSYDRILVQNSFTFPIGKAQFLTARKMDAFNLYLTGKQNPEGERYYYKRYIYLVGDPKLKLKVDSNLAPSVALDSKIRIDFKSETRPERFVSFVNPHSNNQMALMCSYDEKGCADLLAGRFENTTQFNFPILLNNYVFLTALALRGGHNMFDFDGRTSLKFFTENPVKNISTRTDIGLSPDIAYRFTGRYCFVFAGKQYCPNILLGLIYGSINIQTKTLQIPKYLDINLIF